MSIASSVLRLAPAPLRSVLLRYREATKFLVVGGICFIGTLVINYSLKLTVLSKKPVVALVIATTLTTILSYLLNREWAFRTRGGRGRLHEMILFTVVSGLGIIINSVPLYISRNILNLRQPTVSLPAQEIIDFLSGMILGTLLAMVFRLWAMKRFVFPQADARQPVARESVDVVAGRRPAGPSVAHRSASPAVAHQTVRPPVARSAGRKVRSRSDAR
jgi:putative flippase GtrA